MIETEWWKLSMPVPDLRPRLSNTFAKALEFNSEASGITIAFPWWDTRQEAQGLLDWLRTAPEGETFCDLDQGWRIDAIRLGDHFHFLDQDFDSGQVHANVVVSRDVFLAALDQAEADARDSSG